MLHQNKTQPVTDTPTDSHGKRPLSKAMSLERVSVISPSVHPGTFCFSRHLPSILGSVVSFIVGKDRRAELQGPGPCRPGGQGSRRENQSKSRGPCRQPWVPWEKRHGSSHKFLGEGLAVGSTKSKRGVTGLFSLTNLRVLPPSVVPAPLALAALGC